MTTFKVARVSYDTLITQLQQDPALKGLSHFLLRTVLTTAAVSAMYFLDEDNDGLRLAAMQVNILSEKMMEAEGVVGRPAQLVVFEAVDKAFAAEYEKAHAAAALEVLETQSHDFTKVES